MVFLQAGMNFWQVNDSALLVLYLKAMANIRTGPMCATQSHNSKLMEAHDWYKPLSEHYWSEWLPQRLDTGANLWTEALPNAYCTVLLKLLARNENVQHIHCFVYKPTVTRDCISRVFAEVFVQLCNTSIMCNLDNFVPQNRDGIKRNTDTFIGVPRFSTNQNSVYI